MSRPADDMPERMRAGGTELERRLLSAGAQEEPSEELSSRMAAAIGVSTAALGAAALTVAASSGAAKAMAVKGSTTVLWPWLLAGTIVVVGSGVVIGAHLSDPITHEDHQPALAAPPSPVAAPVPKTNPVMPRTAITPPNASASGAGRHKATTVAGELRDQIAMMDVARGAVVAGHGARALDVLRRYQEKYPAGSFEPEAAALRIEALIKLGRTAEARSLAQLFVSENRDTPLAERVARIAGLARP